METIYNGWTPDSNAIPANRAQLQALLELCLQRGWRDEAAAVENAIDLFVKRFANMRAAEKANELSEQARLLQNITPENQAMYFSVAYAAHVQREIDERNDELDYMAEAWEDTKASLFADMHP